MRSSHRKTVVGSPQERERLGDELAARLRQERQEDYGDDIMDASEFLGLSAKEAQRRLGLSEAEYDQAAREMDALEPHLRQKVNPIIGGEDGGLGLKVGRMSGRGITLPKRGKAHITPAGKRIFSGI